jgi:hypothetical protein
MRRGAREAHPVLAFALLPFLPQDCAFLEDDGLMLVLYRAGRPAREHHAVENSDIDVEDPEDLVPKQGITTSSIWMTLASMDSELRECLSVENYVERKYIGFYR